MTARAFFRGRQVEGRAVLIGSRTAPRYWLADVGGHLVLCREVREDVTGIADDTPVPTPFVSASQLATCLCWICAAYD